MRNKLEERGTELQGESKDEFNADENVPQENKEKMYNLQRMEDSLVKAKENGDILIGVCGVEGSGKTVFLTSVYRNISSYRENGLRFAIDPDKGGDGYFRDQERQIREKGFTASTVDTSFTGIVLKLKELEPVEGKKEVGINFLDFAGGDFLQTADKTTWNNKFLAKEDRLKYQLIDAFVQACDGIVILVNSTVVENNNGEEIPFPPMLETTLTQFEEKKKPIAVVFTQKDMCKTISRKELIRRIANNETVDYVRKNFSVETDPGKRKEACYGKVSLITCYELDKKSGCPKVQSGGTFWTKDAISITINLIKVILPRHIKKLENRKCAEEAKTLKDEIERRKKEAKTRARKVLSLWTVIALFLLAGGIAFGFLEYRKVQEVKQIQAQIDRKMEQEKKLLEANNFRMLNICRKLDMAGFYLLSTEESAIIRSFSNRSLKISGETETGFKDAFSRQLAKLRTKAPDMRTKDSVNPEREIILQWYGLLNDSRMQKRLELIESLTILNKDIGNQTNIEGKLNIVKGHIVNAADDSFFFDPDYKMVFRKFLVGNTARVLLVGGSKGDNKYVKEALGSASTHIEDDISISEKMSDSKLPGRIYKKNKILFKSVYETLQQDADELDEYQKKFETLDGGLKNLQSRFNDSKRAIDVKYILVEIFDDLNEAQKQEMLEHMIDAIEDELIFKPGTYETGEYVEGIVPLSEEIRQMSKTSYYNALVYLANNPFYVKELETLRALTGLRCMYYMIIRELKVIIPRMRSSLDNGYPGYIDHDLEGLKQNIDSYEVPDKSHLKDSRSDFIRARNDIDRLIRWANEWRDATDSRKSGLLKNYRERLKGYCKLAKNRNSGDCENIDGL